MKKPSLTNIRKQLSSLAFDPRKPGPMAVITDVADLQYFRGRALELIHESYADPKKLGPAIQLLVYTKAVIDNEREEKAKERRKVKEKIEKEENKKLPPHLTPDNIFKD